MMMRLCLYTAAGEIAEVIVLMYSLQFGWKMYNLFIYTVEDVPQIGAN